MRVADEERPRPSVLVVGGGFAGVGCAKELAKHDIPVTLLDRNNYHQFQPLLYQVATAELAHDRRRPPAAGHLHEGPDRRRQAASRSPTVDPTTRTVTTADGADVHRRLPGAGGRLAAELLPHARAPRSTPSRSTRSSDAGACAPGSSRSSRRPTPTPSRIDEGALNFVIVGAGPTGVETAGAVADLVNEVMPKRFHDLDVDRTRIYLIDHGPVVLGAVLRQGPRLRGRQAASTTG